MPRSPAGTSVRDALDSAVVGLTAAGVDTPRLDAEVLLADLLGTDRTALFLERDRELDRAQARAFLTAVKRRQGREPVAYIVGRKGFRGIELAVDRRVLVPRPETEHLVEAALELPAGARVVDVGTGSGAVALALKHERGDLRVLATDASADALAVARANARALALDVELVHGDLLAGVAPVDAVVSNPPYVGEGEPLMADVARHEPHQALFAGADGLAVIRRLAPAAAAAGARFLALEHGASQADAVERIVHAAGFEATERIRDLAGFERVLVGRR